MHTRLHNQDPSSTSVQNSPLQPRPFTDESEQVAELTSEPTTQSLQTRLENSSHSGHDFSSIPIFSPRSKPMVQTKLTVGEPDDQYEQEADQVAEQVMSMPDSSAPVQRQSTEEEAALQTKPLASSITPLLQRQVMPEEEEVQAKSVTGTLQREAIPEEEEEPVQTKPESAVIQREAISEEEEEEPVQTKPESVNTLQREALPEEEEAVQTKLSLQRSSDGSVQASNTLEQQLNNSGSGSPLSEDVRTFMEPRFGVDFSGVRVHTGSESVQMNRELNAQAFTHKQNIYFGSGKLPARDALTAHELTHVVQQTGGIQLKHSSPIEIDTLTNTTKPDLSLKTAPSATESVGGTNTTLTFAPGAPGSGTMGALSPGDKGYTEQLLPMVPEAATQALAYYKDAHLKPVTQPTFAWHHREISRYSLGQRKAEKEVSGWSPPSINKLWEQRAEGYKKFAEKTAAEIYTIQTLCKSFNAWVPRANLTFISLARLEGLQELLGVKDPSEMTAAVTESLKQAQLVAERAKISNPGSIDVPEADRQVSSSVEATTMAARKMRTAWLGFQQTLVQKNISALKKAGEGDEQRLKEINEVIETWGNIGKTVDISLSLLEGGGKLMAAENLSQAKDTAKGMGKTAAKGVGIDIPSDAEGILKGITKLVYFQEIEKIETKLDVLKKSISAHDSVARELGVTEKISAFEVALSDYKREGQEMLKRLLARRLAYLRFGQQLDEAARKDPMAISKGIAPGKSKERFATVMLVTSAVREVLAMGNGAKTSFDTPSSLRAQISNFKVIQDSPSDKVPFSETEPLVSIYNQTMQFHGNVNTLGKTLGPIDQQAAAMMQALSGNEEIAGAY